MLSHAFARATKSGRPLDPPLLVVLDEAAHIAPLPELDGLAATCASHGIQIVTVWQDLAQVRGRYGARAPTVLNNHRAKLFLPGIADPDTLEYASRLIGDEEASHPSVTRDPDGQTLDDVDHDAAPAAAARGAALPAPGSRRAGLRDSASGPAAAAALVGARGDGLQGSVGCGGRDAWRCRTVGRGADSARARSSDSLRSCALVARAAARSNSRAASLVASEAVEQVAPHAREQVIALEGARLDQLIDEVERGVGARGHGDRDGPVELDDR